VSVGQGEFERVESDHGRAVNRRAKDRARAEASAFYEAAVDLLDVFTCSRAAREQGSVLCCVIFSYNDSAFVRSFLRSLLNPS